MDGELVEEKREMDEVEIRIVERFGQNFEQDGLPRIAGRVFGLMMLSEDAMTLDEMAEALQVSKASVSTNTRLLHHFGTLKRESRPGDRRTYYRISPDALVGGYERVIDQMSRMEVFVTEAKKSLPSDKEVARQRLSRMAKWYRFMLREMEGLMERWEKDEDGEALR